MTKKLFVTILLSIFGFNIASAETISLSSAKNVCNIGETINVSVGVNSQSKIYTVKTSMGYPKDAVSLKSFTFSPNWMAVSQPGYDLIDEKLGKVIKTAGYPGGINSNVPFGTAIFTCNKAISTAEIGMLTDSVMLNETGENVYTGGNKLSVSVSEAKTNTISKKNNAKPQVLTGEIVNSDEGKKITPDANTNVSPTADIINRTEIPTTTPTNQISIVLSIISLIISCVAIYIVFNNRKK